MTMKRSLFALLLALTIGASASGADIFLVRNPKVTGVFVSPSNADQCRPVKIGFALSNTTDNVVYSQRPYSGDTYNLYQSFARTGIESLPDRYMVGVSINGGKDGFPYRWGFRGALQPGKTAVINGFLTLVEVGDYELVGTLLKGGSPADMVAFKIGKVHVDACVPVSSAPRPMPAEPIYPVYNGQTGYPPVIPYMINGYTYVPARGFFGQVGADVYALQDSIVAAWPGAQLVMYPGTPNVIYNNVPVVLTAPVYVINGVTYIPPRFVTGLMGGSFYWNPYSREMFVDYPPYWW